MTGLFPARRLQVLLPLPLQGVLDYLAPAEMPLRRGDFVSVPLSGRILQGVVWALDPPPSEVPENKLKQVLGRFELPALPESLLTFIDWVAAYTLSPPGAVLKMAISVPRAFQTPKMRTLYRLAVDNPDELTPARRKVWAAALGDMALSLKDWAELAGVGEGTLRGMREAGQLQPVEVAGDAPFPEPDLRLTAPVLSREQAEAARHFRDLVRAHRFRASLLEGVTGAGKTEVYFEAIHEALQQKNKDSPSQVLVLVPEIALTAQWLDRFRDRFGVAPVVWHSGLTPAQRRRAWWAVIRGQARVVVGARSALFLPFQNLMLVVVDEEHSPTYKQEDGVMYHGRDMAVVRAHQAACPVILASATPSLETLVNAESGKYDWLYLGERHGVAELPDMTAIDMRAHPPARGEWLSAPLREAVAETLKRGEQVLLYLNRRGYAPLTLCRACGHRLDCPHCSAWLVEHKKQGRLQCHHCGYSQHRPRNCPACGAEDRLIPWGPGVERVAEEVHGLFPEARLTVMASDELAGPGEIREMVESIARHEVDVIIGTQIVTKGYHFPDLTLVGVVDADLGLAGGDPRAAERTWQQLEQVAGRAGRAEKPGKVLFQTHMPDHPVIRALISGDRNAFLEQEAEEREHQRMPPYGRLAAVILSGTDHQAVLRLARHLAQGAPRSGDVMILGPAPAPLSYLRGRHRYRFLVKAGKTVNIQNVLKNWLFSTRLDGGVRVQVDIDPISFF
ncbi:primosomal protein N' [Luteithermobacter gelatinilyticus]|uniref:primosomal protein N' n=1 Tax=Luteithermobacter gelatinilyticus TaxID=2582913 RepID=UPI001105D1E0|nr:primosomal protein N' [Luteithermobacter gelatinilyticus]